MKASVYLDTTIPSYLFDERESIKMHIDVTKQWWTQESNNFDVTPLELFSESTDDY